MTISLDPVDMENVLSDWWIVIIIPPDDVFPILLGQLPLFDLPAVSFFNGRLPGGLYGFLFIIDDVPDGVFGPTWYDYVVVISQPQGDQMQTIPNLNDLLKEKMRELIEELDISPN